jgi:hypothetical protein
MISEVDRTRSRVEEFNESDAGAAWKHLVDHHAGLARHGYLKPGAEHHIRRGWIGLMHLDSNTTYMANEQAAWTYSFEDTPSNVTINVLDSSGRTVYTTSGTAAAGTHNFVWDGKNNAGDAQTDGVYRLQIKANGPTNEAVASDVNAIELVSGVDLTGTPPKIVSRSGNHPLTSVLGILDFL